MENEQINVIMEKEGLTPSQFAALIGIQRAQVSHLQSNRNRVSLDIVKRIHTAFPAISAEWLLTGSGSYYADGSAAQAPAVPQPENTLFAEMEPTEASETVIEAAENRKITSGDTEIPVFCKENAPEKPQNTVQNAAVQRIECEKRPGRNIVELKIFYDDGTYETFCKK